MKTLKKIFELLSPPEKKRAFLLLAFILVMAIMDMIGVASVLPFIAVLSNPQLVETNVVLAYLFQISSVFGVISSEQFLFVLGVASFIALMVSLLFRAITTYLQARFTLMREYSIGMRLIQGYLRQPYIWFLNQHSADLGKNILSEVSEVIEKAIVPILNIIVYGAVSTTLLILLIVVDPKLALSVGSALIISYGTIFFCIKKFLSRIGAERLKSNSKRYTILTEAFGAIKEVKVRGMEEVYAKSYEKPGMTYANNQSLAKLISDLPRFLIEGIAFGGMIILVLVLMSGGNGFENIVPVIGLYAFAGYRLMPALQQVYGSFTQLRFSGPALDLLNKDLMSLKSYDQLMNDNSILQINKSIIFKGIYFKYSNARDAALKNIDLNIKAYSKVGIIGTTGSGKTTMVDIILGLLDPTEGTLHVDDKLITARNKRSWQKNIGYVPQQIYLTDTSIAENIAFGVDLENIDFNAVEKAARIANLHDFINKELPQKYDTSVGERGVKLSGGQKQRIGIARALYHNPQVLILDEATSALDNITEQHVMEAINNLGNKITVIMIAHRLSTIKKCDMIYLLEEGMIIAKGSYDELDKSNLLFNKKI